MFDVQRRLTERFSTLRDGRTGPVFFIEHGLSKAEALELRDVVGEAARANPLQSSWWRANPLPLIVAATEAGYSYRGTGTDFWPNLQSSLQIDIRTEGRQHVRDLFVAAALKFRGAKPPTTPWTEAFCLIAWPITHALVPVEFHRQLSAALAHLHSDIQVLDDDRLQRAVQTATRHPSVRFESFLDDHRLAVPVIRALLGSSPGEISEDTVARIDTDLKADRDARLDIAVAMRRQQRLRTHSVREMKPKELDLQYGLLQLRINKTGLLALEAAFPGLPVSELQELRRILRRHRCTFKLWGVTARIPSEQLFSGLPFPLRLTSVPVLGSPLLPTLDTLGLDSQKLAILESLRLDFKPPIVFSGNSEEGTARMVLGKEISTSRACWMLMEKQHSNQFAHLRSFSELGPLVCYELDLQEKASIEILRTLGYRIRHPFSVLIAGAPPLENHTEVPRFLVGDERIIVPRLEENSALEVNIGSERILLNGDLARVRVPEGEHVLELSSEHASRRDHFKGSEAAVRETKPICWIDLRVDEKSVSVLLESKIALRVDGLGPLEDLILTLELEVGTRRSEVSFPLGPLPQIILHDSEPWQTLIDEGTREHILHTSQPVFLHAHVGNLAEESWTFNRRIRSCWWVKSPEGLSLESELGQLDYGMVGVDSPAACPVQELLGSTSEGILFAPLNLDEANYGQEATFATYFTAPETIKLIAPSIIRPILRRSLRGSNGALGIQDLAEARLRWSLAESETITAEFRRHQVVKQLDQWLAVLTCGSEWAKREDSMQAQFNDLWQLFSKKCLANDLFLKELVRLTEQVKRELIQQSVVEIQRTIPDLWTRIDPPKESSYHINRSFLDDADYLLLKRACATAYGKLADHHRDAKRNDLADLIESVKPGAKPELWDEIFSGVLSGSELEELGELLLPTDTAQSLMSLDLTVMSLGELAEEFHRWALDSRRALVGELPSVDIFRAVLAFWISPELALSLDWRIAMSILLKDRAIARAGRYLSLRARDPRQGGISL